MVRSSREGQDGHWQWTRREVIGDLYGDVWHHVRHHGPAGGG
jgi:hypothetical protein